MYTVYFRADKKRKWDKKRDGIERAAERYSNPSNRLKDLKRIREAAEIVEHFFHLIGSKDDLQKVLNHGMDNPPALRFIFQELPGPMYCSVKRICYNENQW